MADSVRPVQGPVVPQRGTGVSGNYSGEGRDGFQSPQQPGFFSGNPLGRTPGVTAPTMGPGFGYPSDGRSALPYANPPGYGHYVQPGYQAGYQPIPAPAPPAYTSNTFPTFGETALEIQISDNVLEMQRSMGQQLAQAERLMAPPPAYAPIPQVADRPASVPPPVPQYQPALQFVPQPAPQFQPQPTQNSEIQELRTMLAQQNQQFVAMNQTINQLRADLADARANRPAAPVTQPVSVAPPPAAPVPTPVPVPAPAPVVTQPEFRPTPGFNHQAVAGQVAARWRDCWIKSEKASEVTRLMGRLPAGDRIEIARQAGLVDLALNQNHGDENHGTLNYNTQHLLLNVVYEGVPAEQAAVVRQLFNTSGRVYRNPPTYRAFREMVRNMNQEQRAQFVAAYGREDLITHMEAVERHYAQNATDYSERFEAASLLNKCYVDLNLR